MSGIDYQALRVAVPIEQVLALLNFQPSRCRGRQLRGPCPVHDPGADDDRRCFSVHLERHVFRCFICGAHGNQLDLWRQVHRLPLYEAALHLCRHAAIPPPRPAPKTHRRHPGTRNPPPASPAPATD